jgi:hypothetical protein
MGRPCRPDRNQAGREGLASLPKTRSFAAIGFAFISVHSREDGLIEKLTLSATRSAITFVCLVCVADVATLGTWLKRIGAFGFCGSGFMPRRLDLSGQPPADKFAPPTVDPSRPFEIAVGPTLVARYEPAG